MIYVLGPDVPGWWVAVGALVLAASCGLRGFFAPFALVCIGALDGLEGPESTATALLAGGLAVAEIVFDKLPGWDEALDAAGLVWKPVWAVAVVGWQVPLDDTLWLGLIAAGAAVAVASGKARLRVQAPTRRTARIFSAVEDVAGVVLVMSALYAPYIAAPGLVAFAVVQHVGAFRLGQHRWALPEQ